MNERIIRAEAIEYFRAYINYGPRGNPIALFRDLKVRVFDFYEAESKAIFLDEIEKQLSVDLKNHRNSHHNGQPGVDCQYENNAEKLLFYIHQEIDTLPLVARQKNKSNPRQIRNKVFISYSQKDKDFLYDIQRHFKPFSQLIDLWDDTKITPGQRWKEEIKNAIDQTKVAILLVSTDFLGSDFISTDELPPLLKAAEENGAVILILILKPCYFEAFAELNQYQTVNPPSNPIIKMNEADKEELYVNLVRQTKRVLEGAS